MAIGKPLGDFANNFNSLYNISFDLSGWDKTTIQIVSPMSGAVNVQGTNDSGAVLAITQGNAELAQNFMPIQAKNLLTGLSSPYIYGAGLYEVDANSQFLRLQGQPASAGTNVYKLIIFNSKIS